MALRDAAIVGYAETKIVEKEDRDIWEMGADILDQLLARTGFEKQNIDGLVMSASMTGAGNPFWSQTTADQLGLELDFCQIVDLGGCSSTAALARACMAIDAGMCTTVLCLYADAQSSDNNRRPRGFEGEWTGPLGYLGPPAAFGLLSKRYEHQFGLDYAMLGKLAVAQRGHAVINDLACEKLRKPITVDDYLNSRMIADPIRLLDSVMVCDGASGLIVTSAKNAKARGISKYVVPLGYGERTMHRVSENITEVTETGHLVAGKRAFAQSGLAPKDIGSYHPYDDFIIAIMLQLEMLGFCKPGQGCDFIREHDFTHTGDLPLNTGGGQISAGQAGLAGGGTNLIEGVRQLFGEGGKRQVKSTKSALVTGIGGIPYGRNWSTSVVMIIAPNG
ncbi:MAG TPA: thiolase family protein [Xanthobacteraceae bacterium]|nr:thiolase family protein [Xanthobacteraceae bacterium]